MNDPQAFFELVARMRQSQRDYFNKSNRQDIRQRALEESKRLEMLVDQAIAASKNGQAELF